jgi:hypothetical protein
MAGCAIKHTRNIRLGLSNMSVGEGDRSVRGKCFCWGSCGPRLRTSHFVICRNQCLSRSLHRDPGMSQVSHMFMFNRNLFIPSLGRIVNTRSSEPPETRESQPLSSITRVYWPIMTKMTLFFTVRNTEYPNMFPFHEVLEFFGPPVSADAPGDGPNGQNGQDKGRNARDASILWLRLGSPWIPVKTCQRKKKRNGRVMLF